MSTEYYNLTPGPQYDVKDKPDQIKVPEYSFGFRRGEAVRNKVCTPDAVGPGRYLVENASEKTSNRNACQLTCCPKRRSLNLRSNATTSTRPTTREAAWVLSQRANAARLARAVSGALVVTALKNWVRSRTRCAVPSA